MDYRTKIHIEAKFLPSQKIHCFSAYSSAGKTAFENCLFEVKCYSKLLNERYELLYIFKVKEPVPINLKPSHEEKMLEKTEKARKVLPSISEKSFDLLIFVSSLFNKFFEQVLIALEILFAAAIIFPFIYLAFGSASNVHHVYFFKTQLGIFLSSKFFKYYLYLILFFVLTRFIRKLSM